MLRNILLFWCCLLFLIKPAYSDEQRRILIVPLIDKNFQLVHINYDKTEFVMKNMGGALGYLASISGDSEILPATHYRPQPVSEDVEKIIVEKIVKEISRKNKNAKIIVLDDKNEETRAVYQLLFERQLIGEYRQSSKEEAFLKHLKTADFDQAIFVSNDNIMHHYGHHVDFPLHGYGFIYDIRRRGTNLSYFGINIVAYDLDSEESIVAWDKVYKGRVPRSFREPEEWRRMNLIGFLEREYAANVDVLPGYAEVVKGKLNKIAIKKIINQYRDDFNIRDNPKKFNELRTILNYKKHHNYDDYGRLPVHAKNELIFSAISLFNRAELQLSDDFDFSSTRVRTRVRFR